MEQNLKRTDLKNKSLFRNFLPKCRAVNASKNSLPLVPEIALLGTSGRDGIFAKSTRHFNFATKHAAVKFLECQATAPKKEISVTNYDASATWPECPRKERRGKSFWLYPRKSCLCGVVTSPTVPKAAAPANLLRGKAGVKMNEFTTFVDFTESDEKILTTLIGKPCEINPSTSWE